MFGPELVQAFREFKSIWDPDWKMNPGKLVEPYRLDENLRLGADYRPWQPQTHFQFPQDQGSLVRATQRCVGVGKCRHHEGGVMCPSFRVTREEEHSEVCVADIPGLVQAARIACVGTGLRPVPAGRRPASTPAKSGRPLA